MTAPPIPATSSRSPSACRASRSSSWRRSRRSIGRRSMPADARELLAIADRLAPQFRRAFLAAVEALNGQLTAAAILEALATGNLRALQTAGARRAPPPPPPPPPLRPVLRPPPP